MGWFNVLMTEFIVRYYFSPIHIPFLLPPYPLPLLTPATQAKFIVVSGRKDGVDLVLIYRYVVIFIARFGLGSISAVSRAACLILPEERVHAHFPEQRLVIEPRFG